MKKPEFSRDHRFHHFRLPIPLKRAVMTAEPSILIRKLKSNDLFLIFASDGLWEQLSDEAAVEIVSRNPRSVRPQLKTYAVYPSQVWDRPMSFILHASYLSFSHFFCLLKTRLDRE